MRYCIDSFSERVMAPQVSRVAPLLSFPPDTFKHHRPLSTASERREAPTSRTKRRLIKLASLLPLVFIYSILVFSVYGFLFSLTFGHVLSKEKKFIKSFVYSVVFIWLCGGSAWSVGQAYVRGGGDVPGFDARDSRRGAQNVDEESANNHAANGMSHSPHYQQPPTRVLARESGAREVEFEDGEDGIEDAPLLGQHNPFDQSEEFNVSDYSLSKSRNSRQSEAVKGSLQVGGVQLKSDGRSRFCRKCLVYKPDRSHHCSSCEKCVLKMDHHCPWLGGGCVGWANYKFFLLFLWYSGALGMFIGVVTLLELMDFVADGANNYETAPVTWALILLLGLVFGITVSLFGLYHFYLACRNRTTIENMERAPTFAIRARQLNDQAGKHHDPLLNGASENLARGPMSKSTRKRLLRLQGSLNIYDLGWRQNLIQVFGENWWLWGVPIGWPPGEGTTYPVNRETLKHLETIAIELQIADQHSNGTSFRREVV